LHLSRWWHWHVLRILHSRSVAEADTEVVAVVVPMEVEAEAASTVAAVVVADFMEAVAEVFTAEAAERIAAVVVVVRIAAVAHRVTLLAAWVPMDAAAAACMAARVRMARTAERVRME
jgi:hypothetical protein